MSCQRILSMLSVYIDGEVQSDEGALIKEHLASCASCAHEFAELKSVSTILAATSEVAPPAFLLEQIEAATINCPTFPVRLQTVWNSMWQVPQGVRWAAASVTAACALVVILVSQPGEQRVAHDQAVKYQANSVIAAQPATTAETQTAPLVVAKVVNRSSRMHKAIVTNTLAHRTTLGQPKPAKEIKEPVEATLNEEVVADASLSADDVAAEQPKPNAEEVRSAKAAAYQEARLKQEADALAEVRVQLAARNSRRNYDTHIERIEGKKYSVELASIRF